MTRLRSGKIFYYRFVTTLLLCLPVKKFENRSAFDKVRGKNILAAFSGNGICQYRRCSERKQNHTAKWKSQLYETANHNEHIRLLLIIIDTLEIEAPCGSLNVWSEVVLAED